ncbi:MAG: flagellar assembly protein FliW [Planctomycetota bacterium]
MQVATNRFGMIEVPEESLITFPEGIVGFPDAKHYVMFDCGEEGLFKWLQSADRPEMAFVICEASLIVPDYRILLGERELETVKLSQPVDGLVCLILCIPSNPREMTANLLGPLIFNAEARLGMQVVLVHPEYSARHRVFVERESELESPRAAAEGA